MYDIQSQIISWAREKLHRWEQFCLAAILTNGNLADSEQNRAVELFLHEHGLRDDPEPDFVLPNSPALSLTEGKRLVSFSNLRNVNALASDQRLDIGKNLTVAFGNNGAGKTGYARVLSSACYARGNREVLRNILIPPNEDPQSADLTLTDNDGVPMTFTHVIGDRRPELKHYYCFDSTSVSEHMGGHNALAFTPAALISLNKLASATDDVRIEIQKRISERRRPPNFKSMFKSTPIAEFVNSIVGGNDIAKIQSFIDGVRAAHPTLEQIAIRQADLSVERRDVARRELTTDCNLLANILAEAVELSKITDEKMIQEVETLIERRSHLERRVIEVATLRARPEAIREWDEFASAAHAYVTAMMSTERATYPQAGDSCLLCGQVLHEDGQKHVNELLGYVEQGVRSDLEAVNSSLTRNALAVRKIQPIRYDPSVAGFDSIARIFPVHQEAVLSAVSSLNSRLRLTNSLLSGNSEPRPEFADCDSALRNLEAAKKVVNAAIRDFEASDLEKEIAALGNSDKMQRAFTSLESQIPSIREWLETERWCAVCSDKKNVRTTRHITEKYTALHGFVVRDKYVERFTERVQSLCPSIQVTAESESRKGSSVKRIQLTRAQSSYDNELVLSEGEQKAIALADFLAETSLDSNLMGLILDDPVTSLDFAWKDKIAETLASEARNIQVFVFTHDFHFLSALSSAAFRIGAHMDHHWIQNRDGIPGLVALNESPAIEDEFKNANRARQYFEVAKNEISPAKREQAITSAFGALRTSYEALVIYDVFSNVVRRFEARISLDNLHKVVCDRDVLQDIKEANARISRWIDAHLHPDSASRPDISTLKHEIETYDEIKRRIREAKKTVN